MLIPPPIFTIQIIPPPVSNSSAGGIPSLHQLGPIGEASGDDLGTTHFLKGVAGFDQTHELGQESVHSKSDTNLIHRVVEKRRFSKEYRKRFRRFLTLVRARRPPTALQNWPQNA